MSILDLRLFPVFFDVAFIILVPVIYALERSTKRSLLLYAIPLLAGLAITHAFIPPTPGPIAVADIIGAELGWVILAGFLVGIPTAIISGPVFGRYISEKIFIEASREKLLGNYENAVVLYKEVLKRDEDNHAAAYRG